MKMKKIYPLILVWGLVGYLSCRKVDQPSILMPPNELRFFNEHKSTDPSVQIAAKYVKDQNEKYHFVETVIKRIGYPYWDKSVVTSGFRTKGYNKGATEGTTIFIPFALENQNIVDASLVISFNSIDTTFEYLVDWQYHERSHGSATVDTTAENFASLFMMMGRRVFGDSIFKITDSSLFAASPQERTKYVRVTPPHSNKMFPGIYGRGTDWVLGELCYDGFVCGSPWYEYCADADGCDYKDPCHYNNTCHVTLVCVDGWLWDSETGGGGSGGGSSGGGSGSGGPGVPWLPPQCSGGVSKGALYDICTPGWSPDPAAINTIKPPCEKIAPLATDQYYKDAVNDLKSRIATDNRETAYTQKSEGGPMLGIFSGPQGECESLVPIFPSTPVLRAYVHNHYNGCTCPLFSPLDLKAMYDVFLLGKPDPNFTYTVVTSMGVYSLVFDDMEMFEGFYQKWFMETTFDLKELKQMYDWYKIDFSKPTSFNEQKFLEMIKEEKVGVKLLKANADLSGYSLLTLNRDGILTPIPCN